MNIPEIKPIVQLWVACIMAAVGAGLLIAGFVVPPKGEIHHSVLVAFGEILTFSGAVLGMRYKYKYGTREDSDKP